MPRLDAVDRSLVLRVEAQGRQGSWPFGWSAGYWYVAAYVPAVAVKTAYEMPLIVCVVKTTLVPPRVIELSVLVPDCVGSIAWSPFAPAPTAIVNPRLFPLQPMFEKEELLRPSVQSSICFVEITGTPRASAASTMAREPSWSE